MKPRQTGRTPGTETRTIRMRAAGVLAVLVCAGAACWIFFSRWDGSPPRLQDDREGSAPSPDNPPSSAPITVRSPSDATQASATRQTERILLESGPFPGLGIANSCYFVPGTATLAPSWADLDEVLLAGHVELAAVRPCVRELVGSAAAEEPVSSTEVEACWALVTDDDTERQDARAARILEIDVLQGMLRALGATPNGADQAAPLVLESDLRAPWGPFLVARYLTQRPDVERVVALAREASPMSFGALADQLLCASPYDEPASPELSKALLDRLVDGNPMLRLSLAERMRTAGAVAAANAVMVEAYRDLQQAPHCSEPAKIQAPPPETEGLPFEPIPVQAVCRSIGRRVAMQLASSGSDLPPLGDLEGEVRAWTERFACGELPCARGSGRRTDGRWSWNSDDVPDDAHACLERVLSAQFPQHSVDVDVEIAPGIACTDDP